MFGNAGVEVENEKYVIKNEELRSKLNKLEQVEFELFELKSKTLKKILADTEKLFHACLKNQEFKIACEHQIVCVIYHFFYSCIFSQFQWSTLNS